MMEFQIIRGTTRCTGLIGNPVSHSLSPLIMNHLFRKMNLPFVYIPLPVQYEDLHVVINGIRALGFIGAQITIPYKGSVPFYCDELSELSTLTNTVNTICFSNGILYGTTTDAEGFFKALSKAGRFFENDNVVILGNGGVSKTLGYAYAMEKRVRSLTLLGRDYTKVKQLSTEITNKTGMLVSGATIDSNIGEVKLAECTLLVNCTSVGMWPNTKETPLDKKYIHAGMSVFDTVYNPYETLLIQEAKEKGCVVYHGLTMLLYQALASFKCWTGLSLDVDLFDIEELKSNLQE